MGVPVHVRCRRLFARVDADEPAPPWRGAFIVAFTGMRGAVSLAAALAIPDERRPAATSSSSSASRRSSGRSASRGCRCRGCCGALGVHEDDAPQREEDKARLLAAEAAIARVDELRRARTGCARTPPSACAAMYRFRSNRFRQRLGKEVDGVDEDIDGRSQDYQRLLREILEAQRAALIELRREGRIGDDVMRRVERDLDLEETRLEIDRG